MKIAVCIKQVPVVSALRFDSEKKTLVREGVPNEINSFDILAVSKAISLKRDRGGEVIVLTMGPPQAKEVLVYGLALGADRAIHLSDRAFAGADTLATSRALALALQHIGADLILCGRYSVDAETGQVGPEVAELLAIPQITGVRKLTIEGQTLTAERETDDGYDVVQAALPVLLTVAEGLIEEMFPSPDDLAAAAEHPIETLTAADLNNDLNLFGLAGSPTWVKEIRSVEMKRAGQVERPETPEQGAAQLRDFLLAQGLFGIWPVAAQTPSWPQDSGRREQDRAVWVLVEAGGDHPRTVSLELLSRATELARTAGGEVAALLFGGPGVEAYIPELVAYGADRIYLAVDESLRSYHTEPYTALLATTIEHYRPYAVLVAASVNGRDLAPRVAARLQLGLTGDVIGLEIDEQGKLAQLKPAFGGNIVAPIYSRTMPQMATVRAGMLSKLPPQWTRQATITLLDTTALPEPRARVLESVTEIAAQAGRDLDEAEVVIGVGMGIGGPENLPAIQALASVMGAAIGATRNITDLGWLPRQRQIGLTGKAVSPRIYLGIGVRGAFEHLVGLRRASVIAAINKNPKAMIFKQGDFGIVGEWSRIVPLLTVALTEARLAGSSK